MYDMYESNFSKFLCSCITVTSKLLQWDRKGLKDLFFELDQNTLLSISWPERLLKLDHSLPDSLS